MTTAFHRPLRLALAFWFGALGLAPALSLADTSSRVRTAPPPKRRAMSRPTRSGSWTPARSRRSTTSPFTAAMSMARTGSSITCRMAARRPGKRAAPIPASGGLQHGQVCYAYPNYHDNAANCFVLYRRPSGEIQFVAIADAGFAYLASFSLKPPRQRRRAADRLAQPVRGGVTSPLHHRSPKLVMVGLQRRARR